MAADAGLFRRDEDLHPVPLDPLGDGRSGALRRLGGDNRIVNYRMKGDLMVVDYAIDRAILVSGVGWSQEKITIARRVIMRDRNALARLATVACLVLPIAARQTIGTEGLIASSAPAELSSTTADTIARDLAGKFVDHIGPGTGTIVLASTDTAFASSLKPPCGPRAMRSRVMARQGRGALIPLAYVVDRGDGEILVRLFDQDLRSDADLSRDPDWGRAVEPDLASAARIGRGAWCNLSIFQATSRRRSAGSTGCRSSSV